MAKKSFGLSRRDQVQCAERLESVIFNFCRGNTKREVLKSHKQVCEIFERLMDSERNEIIAEFAKQPK